MPDLVILAGATGDLGARIAGALVRRGATVRALVRPGTDAERTAPLAADDIEVTPVAFDDAAALADACRGAQCIVSALSGLDDVIVTAQTQLLNAAVAAGIPASFHPTSRSTTPRFPKAQTATSTSAAASAPV